MSFFSRFASVYLSMKECILPSRAREAQEEILADLHSCLEQLTDRASDMESRMKISASQMVIHANASKSDKLSAAEKIREKKMAKHFLSEKRRIQQEYDNTMKNVYVIQQQIDAVVSSHLNFIIVDTMKQFNVNTARLSLPQTTRQVEFLEDQLNDRTREIVDLQEAISNMSNVGKMMGGDSVQDDDAELWNEIETYLTDEPNPTTSSLLNQQNNLAKKEIEKGHVANKLNEMVEVVEEQPKQDSQDMIMSAQDSMHQQEKIALME